VNFIFFIILAVQGAFLFIIGLSTVEWAASLFNVWPGIGRRMVTSLTIQNGLCIKWP